MTRYFVTGTDTEVGKTFCTAALLHALQVAGKTAMGFKPIASGSNAQGLNDDVLTLQAASSLALPYTTHNCYTFHEATAPHLAAQDTACPIAFEPLQQALAHIQSYADVVLTEGAGGWFTPLNAQHTFADWVIAQQMPVILVVGMKLGCINHALLSAQAIRQAGLPLAGWIGNCLNAQPHRLNDYFATLQQYLAASCLGLMPYLPDATPQQAAEYLTVQAML